MVIVITSMLNKNSEKKNCLSNIEDVRQCHVKVVEASVSVIQNSSSQDKSHPDDRTSLNYDLLLCPCNHNSKQSKS